MQDLDPSSPTYGDFYGTTSLGGTDNDGTVFLIKPTSGTTATRTVLYSFTGGTADGANPYAALAQDLDQNSPTYGDFYGPPRPAASLTPARCF